MVSLGSLFSLLFALYICTTVWTFGKLWFPATCSEVTDVNCVGPILQPKDQTVTIAVFVSRSAKSTVKSLRNSPEYLVLREDSWSLGDVLDRDIILPFKHFGTRNNGSLTSHVLVWPTDDGGTMAEDGLPATAPLLRASASITRHLEVRNQQHKMLLGDAAASSTPSDVIEQWPEGPVTHLRPHLGLKFVHPLQSGFPREDFVPELRSSVVRVGNRLAYKPVLWVDDLSVLYRDFVPISTNTSKEDPAFKIKVQPVSLGFFRLLVRLQESLAMMKDFGLTEQDLEQVKELVAGTPWQWMLATFAVSILHSFFAFLAFKNDVGFWRGRTNMEGLSARSFIANFVCQVIIFLNLLEGGQTSMIVLVEIGIGVAIEGWKAAKIMTARGMGRLSYWRGSTAKTCDATNCSKEDIQTDEYDAYATRMLSYVMYPIVIVYAMYCLIYEPQRSWLSWVLSTLSKGVYMFGFITMTPQLYINYKLKSVAHLPWKAFMYKAFNTFIDDVFAFAIAMPMVHRLACLRDDLVFFIYLYQRWLYPVDKKRTNEFGRAYEESSEEVAAEDAQQAAGEKDAVQKKDD